MRTRTAFGIAIPAAFLTEGVGFGRGLSRATLALLILSSVGCTVIRGFPEPPRTSTANKPTEGYQLGPAAIVLYNAENDPTQKKIIRNEIIDARMAEIDSKFADYERSLYKEGVGWGVGTDWAVLSITAATTIVGATKTKTALGAISTAVVGGQAAFDKQALFDKTLPALMAQMVAEREKIRANIRTREDGSVESYTWFAADTDLHNFEFAGSIPGAISVISLDAGQKAGIAAQQVNDLTKGKFEKDNAGDALRKFWKPDGTNIDTDNEAKLKAWMGDNGLNTAPGSVPMFLRDADLATLRQRAVKELKLSSAD